MVYNLYTCLVSNVEPIVRCSGSLEFVVPAADPSSFFPISARFSSSKTLSDLKVTNILPLKGGATPKFSQRTQLVTENYQVV
nr:coatomer subunit delta [Ipomoea trifida]